MKTIISKKSHYPSPYPSPLRGEGMTVKRIRRFSSVVYFMSVIPIVVLAGMMVSASAASVPVNPHWTGKHCAECHVGGKPPELQFSGEIVKVCNRCHGDVPPVCAKVHITNSLPPETILDTILADWPRMEGKVTCLTCHAVQLQMYGNSSEEKDNPSFLRGSEPGSLYRFCFNCHKEENFQKTNPHQLSGNSENRPVCFRCHTENLYSGFETSFQASVKTRNPSLCLGCHWDLGEEHIGHVLLEAHELSENEVDLKALEQEGIDLPLPEGRMHCTTCHNPHPPGIIGRKKAAAGAGEEYFLRIPDAQTFCGACHADGSVDQKIQQFREKKK
jgi:hypothetical protein